MSKPGRPKARLPLGFVDAPAATVQERATAIDAILATYRQFGFDPLETPAIEYLDALGKNLPDEDAPDEGVFALQDDDEQWVALRYDLTAPLARYVAQNRQDLPTPFRRYQYGPVWRREKPGPGRFRQFYQCDFDTVGSASMGVDAEACALLSAALTAVGLGPDQHEVRVNDRKVLTGILARSGVDDAPKQLEVLRSVDKLDRLGRDAVAELLGAGRTDPSGDVTAGAQLDDAQIDLVLRFIDAGSGATTRADVVAALAELVGDDPVGREGVDELSAIDRLLGGSDAMPQVVFDPTVVRGLAYYTGPVFEAALTFETLDEKGRPRQFGSVAGGGRYDDLVHRFTGQDVPACGASIGVDRLLAALRSQRADRQEAIGPVVVTVMDRDRLADYQSMVDDLRAAGLRAELYQGTQSFQKQLKYADKRAAPVAVIAGGDELDADPQVVQVKDLVAGAERSKEITDRDEWRTDRSAQQSVPRAELVAAVRAIVDGEAR
ncbi:histidine--tRNA ligase [Iamia sp. SCSIO 61187]|uniref:histidine--tRNA ligase n=1 Tax=Iamia sp. SCSIO 61187 TaxID=2722752 RepID=UPI001C632960|nr:histidine--tRNA ligase [Iamia sp. SCSIO 61187]QYG95167.1 histidine--tRNA ligase [Iamia sp. SCSIO 61187]